VPVIAGGDQPFQPVWTDDVGEALAEAVERADLAGRTLDVAGPERTTMHDLLDRLARLTGRSPVRVPLPGPLASLGVKLAEAVGLPMPINESQLTMLAEGNVIDAPAENALDGVLRVTPTPLDEGLRRLLDVLPEQLPEEGVGALRRRRFWADVRGARLSPEALLHRLCAHFQEVTPDRMDLDAEPGTPRAVLAEGQTVTMALPMRGTVQVRVVELTARGLTLQTVEGHPLAGRCTSPASRAATRCASRCASSSARPTCSTTWRWRRLARGCSARRGATSSAPWSRRAAARRRTACRSPTRRWRATRPSARSRACAR
jgi:NADH dehydrogenase